MNEDINVIFDSPEELNIELNEGTIQYGQLKIGTTTTGAAGTKAKVENVGSSGNAILNFTIPKGDKGERGEQGIQGIQGEPGKDGERYTAGEGIEITEDNVINCKVEEANPIGETEGNGNLSLLDNAGEGLIEFTVEGKSEQETRSGKNLLNFSLSTQTVNGLTITNNKDGSLTLNGTTTDIVSMNLSDVMLNLPAGTYTLSRNGTGDASATFDNILYARNSSSVNIGSVTGNDKKVINTTIDYAEYNLWLYIKSGVTFTNYVMKPQLEVGEECTDFERYGASPSPDYPSEIKSISGVENLLNIEEISEFTSNGVVYSSDGNYIYANGTASSATQFPSSGGFFDLGYFEVGTYNISWKLKSGSVPTPVGTAFYLKNSNNVQVARKSLASEGGTSFTLNEASNLYLWLYVDAGTVFDKAVMGVQLEEGSITHNHVPSGSNYLVVETTNENSEEAISLINLKGNELCSIGNFIDELLVKNGQALINKNIKKLVLNGSENWGHNPNNGNMFINGTGFLKASEGGKCISDHFVSVASDSGEGMWIGESTFLIIRDSKFASTTELKTWLSENNVTVYYISDTPETIDLGEVSIETVQSDCTLTLEEELNTDMFVKYIKNNPYNEGYMPRIEVYKEIQRLEALINQLNASSES